jgi:hypothetical protein
MCAATDVMLWSEADGDFVAQEAGTCYSPQCTADIVDSCGDDQSCNTTLGACVDLGTCAGGDATLCDDPLGYLCNANNICEMCVTAADCPSET